MEIQIEMKYVCMGQQKRSCKRLKLLAYHNDAQRFTLFVHYMQIVFCAADRYVQENAVWSSWSILRPLHSIITSASDILVRCVCIVSLIHWDCGTHWQTCTVFDWQLCVETSFTYLL